MLLYHGSNVEVARPRIITPNRALDFGAGFYTNNTMTVINDFMAGSIDEQTALILLKLQKLANQFAFLTAKALELLVFREAVPYGE